MSKKDNEGLTPLDVAQQNENEECVKLIQQTLEPTEKLNEKEGHTDNDKLLISAEVHTSEVPSESEENNDGAIPNDSEKSKAKDTVTEDVDDQVSSSQPKKAEKHIRFCLEPEEIEEVNGEEKSKELDVIHDDATTENENEKGNEQSTEEVQTSEITVSYIILAGTSNRYNVVRLSTLCW